MELISYAMDFSSFLIENLKDITGIKSIILFGSVARNQAERKSDIDIFIDVIKGSDKLEKDAKKIVDDFYNSVKYKNYWKLKGINNEINIIVDEIDKWKLKDSMMGNAIILYQKYSPRLENGMNKAILSWDIIKPESKRTMLNKKLFGYKHYKRHYKGLVEEYACKRIGKNAILVPIEQLSLFLKEIHNLGVTVKIRRVFDYD